MRRGEATTLAGIRQGLLVLLVAGLVGTGTELILMGHTEDLLQLSPLLLLGLGLLTLAWHALATTSLGLRVFRVIMLLSLASGVTGSLLHYQGNVEFEIEMSPGLQGLDLFKEAVTGATPALAPGTMVLLGALGLLFTLRHPRFHAPSDPSEET